MSIAGFVHARHESISLDYEAEVNLLCELFLLKAC